MEALLVLEDGRAFRGRSFGAPGESFGEVVFNTSMTGYQEVLTDPSYRGQIVAMTYPLQGNYGVNSEDPESSRVQVAGFVVREVAELPSSWRGNGDLPHSLREQGAVGIQGVDTRALTRHIRDRGAMMGAVSTVTLDPEALARKVRAAPALGTRDVVREVTCARPHVWTEELTALHTPAPLAAAVPSGTLPCRVAAYDFGIKRNILRSLASLGCSVTVLPATSPAEDALALAPDGIFLSNGPGDPATATYAIEAVRKLAGRKPLFGICLGHQILALALGARTFKLKFGHRGGNQPVLDLATRKVSITAQNHGYAVDPETLPAGARCTEINLNDRTCEGLDVPDLNAWSVQYHPEASPGPRDASHHFLRFVERMRSSR